MADGVGENKNASEGLTIDRAETWARISAIERDLEGVVAASELVATDDEHDPEGATIAYDRAQLTAVLEQARQHVIEIDAALDRVREGTYGKCQVCRGAIPAERLAARPATPTCVGCAGSMSSRR